MKTFLKILLALVVILALVILVLVRGKQPEAFPANSESAARLQAGTLAVTMFETEFVDHSRPTVANGDFPGAAERRLAATVWQPVDRYSGPYPLLVYSHGFSSSRREGVYLAEHLASLGYVVIAPEFPLTNLFAPGGPRVQDVVNQPGDVSFLIDRLLVLDKTPGHRLESQVDASRIGALGLSLGGLTTTLVSFHPEWRDPRIKAALSIAGPSFLFTADFYQHHTLPFLMLAGDIDAVVPYELNAAPIPERVPGGELVTIAGASHSGFAGPAAILRWLDNADSIACYIVQRRIGDDIEEPWYDLVGPPGMGVDYSAEPELCISDPLPPAMNVLYQLRLTRVVVSSFFQREFSLSGVSRRAADNYLREVLPRELPAVQYRTGQRLPAPPTSG